MAGRKIEFSVEGSLLRGWFFNENLGNEKKGPTVIMAHGFSAQKEHHLEKFATYFSRQGLNVLVYDHRHWGESEGLPRFEIDPEEQIRDFRHALTFAEGLEEVDAERLGIWGTSFSGGHAIVVGAIDRRVKAVVAQVPFVDGYENFRRRTPPEAIKAVEEKFLQDRRKRAAGGEPGTLKVVTADFRKSKAVIPGERAFAFFTAVPDYPNMVTLRSLEMARDYVPLNFIERISPTPFLLIASLNDSITPTDLQMAAFERALSPKELLTLRGDHFSAYQEEFEVAAEGAAGFFIKHL